MNRRRLLLGTGALLALPVLRARAGDALFPPPDQPLRWVVPFPAGGTSDVRARQVAERLRADAGWNVIVDNKPGASGQIGSEWVARAPADGTTLLLGTIGTLAINPHLFPQQPYDVQRDFQPVTQFSRSVTLLVAHRGSGLHTLADLVAAARTGLPPAFASTGNATIGHMVSTVWQQRAGITLTHVPYKGTAPAVQDFIGGHVPLLFETPAAVWEHLKTGVAVPLAITGRERMPQMPQVPTFAERGYPDVVFDTWQGVVVRRGLPQAALATLNREIVRALRHPEVVRSHEEQVNTVVAGSPQAFEQFIAAESVRWQRVVAATGARVA
ncbi:Bug family tripartite tricarboxylate transporter substrate binding protein [Pseudorhodoferax sp.]|uniref:Bug family tripartite tricarboxylate transporter substrate binding protein n=1 Tax=Pseudorhodoferax sp. TaxID=1993553 RepID=UPI002DD63025|nr:tripartite tricarboxylate transporter substrate-binding protein [Pseudorhodoferax sp.]